MNSMGYTRTLSPKSLQTTTHKCLWELLGILFISVAQNVGIIRVLSTSWVLCAWNCAKCFRLIILFNPHKCFIWSYWYYYYPHLINGETDSPRKCFNEFRRSYWAHIVQNFLLSLQIFPVKDYSISCINCSCVLAKIIDIFFFNIFSIQGILPVPRALCMKSYHSIRFKWPVGVRTV